MAQQWFQPDDKIDVDQDEIQGDVLIGMQKRAELFLFFEIIDLAAFKTGLAAVAVEIAYLRETRVYESTKKGRREKASISFTANGLRKLVAPAALPAAPVLDPLFLDGAENQAGNLGDKLGEWRAEYRGGRIDGLLLVAAWDADTDEALAMAAAEAERLEDFFGGGVAIVRQEVGRIRRTRIDGVKQEGHEHFGFADGVSQPGVKTLHLPVAISGEKLLANPPEVDQGFPGQDLVDPSHFVVSGKTGAHAWLNDGSYLVYRRLRQDVAAFADYTRRHAIAVHRSPDQVRAGIIGRWQDGTPLVRDPDAPNINENEEHPEKNNAFTFGPTIAPGHPDGDPAQLNCPFAAHIRKIYPRDDIPGPGARGDGVSSGDKEDSEDRRILRAGIAFGRDDEADKGLLFLCYQSSIEDKFDFIQRNWANSPGFQPTANRMTPPAGPPGIDLIIGQGAAPRTQTWSTGTLPAAPRFVIATGGAYLFTPSRSGLGHLAGAALPPPAPVPGAIDGSSARPR